MNDLSNEFRQINPKKILSMETAGKFAAPQSPWRWDDQTNTLVHDRDVTVEKADINAETASEKIDLWNLPPARRPFAYEKHPLEISKDKKTVSVGDIIHVALNMVSDTYFVPERFAEFVKRPELEDFFLHLINYFYWFFEYHESQIRVNPLCVEINPEERSRTSEAKSQMRTALLFVAQKYSNVVLGTGLKQFHHFYWIEGDDGDPLTKRREIIPYSGRVSRTLIDRGYAELLMIFATFLVWITFERKNFEGIRAEIGRIIRTDAFPNPTYSTVQVRNRASRKTPTDLSPNGNNENSNATAMSDRKSTGASRKSVRSQITIATSATDTSNASNTTNGSGSKRQPFRRLLTQRSPVVVTLLPTARDQSAWLFSRRNGKDDQSLKNSKMIPENEFRVRHEVGVLGQPIETLTLIVSGDSPAANTSASQADTNRRSSDISSGIRELTPTMV